MHLKPLIANAFWRYKPIRIWSKGSMHHLLRFWLNDCMTIVSNKTRSILLLKWRCHINHNSLNYNSSFLRTIANQAAKNYSKLNWVWDFSQHEMITINWSKAWTARPSTMVATICLILGNSSRCDIPYRVQGHEEVDLGGIALQKGRCTRTGVWGTAPGKILKITDVSSCRFSAIWTQN